MVTVVSLGVATVVVSPDAIDVLYVLCLMILLEL